MRNFIKKNALSRVKLQARPLGQSQQVMYVREGRVAIPDMVGLQQFLDDEAPHKKRPHVVAIQ